MTGEPELFFETVGDQVLECMWLPPPRAGAPTVVFLHDGLGSLASWRDFPRRLAAATGSAGFVYSRRGYGWSSPRRVPFSRDYLHRAALSTLPRLLDQRGIEEPVLVGHSDGASIAIIHAGGGDRPVRGVILEAPHVFVEDVTVASLEATRRTFLANSDVKDRLARYHKDPEAAFFGWNDIWLDPGFRHWNIEGHLPGIACPVLAIQGEDDEYGTMAQIASIERRVRVRFEKLVLPGCGHTPHREAAARTLAAIQAFIATL